jgi:hypothetical protein
MITAATAGEVCRELVVGGGDASPILEAAEHPFDRIALALGPLVEERLLCVGLLGMTGAALGSSADATIRGIA